MNKKIAVGIINTHDYTVYNKCRNSITSADYIYDIHNTLNTQNIPLIKNINRYISYGGLYNILLRQILQTDADYIFLIKSHLNINDNTIFKDYINTAKIFGTWFMSRGIKDDKFITIEDDNTNLNLCLFENLANDFIFMLKSHVLNCGFFNEGYTNINTTDTINCLEVYEYYKRVVDRIDYLPTGYFPDVDLSLVKINNILSEQNRPNLEDNTTNNITKIYGKFYFNNKFIPGKHKIASRDEAINKLEKIQKIYSIK